MGFRKPEERKQGLKILAYGENNAGKSLFALSFPSNGIIDSESKIGVYENDPEYKDNIAGIADTSDYFETLNLAEDVVSNPDTYKTFTIDSYTNIYNGMQVAAMENEENRARKKGGNVDDATVSQRGWGKVKLNTIRFDGYIAQASAKGITVIAVAHKDDINKEVNGKQVKIGEKPSLRKNAEHTFDVVLRFFKEKDIATNEYKFYVEVEKDTTKTHKIGTKIENATYELFKDYIEKNNKGKTLETKYDKQVESNINSMEQEQESHDQVVAEFKTLFAEATKKDSSNKEVIANVMKEKGVVKYTDPTKTTELKEVIEFIKGLA
ncbi:AAA family ATPase [Halalkalibacter oceani]|uniref:AAA family ATPase n=1 Tax=Halalkalibacter oceani TaxID=1653776 RepID=UPI0033918FC1